MDKAVKINLDSKIYNLEAVLNACYVFIEKIYICIDSDCKGEKIVISLKGKRKLSRKKMEQLKGEFMNELLHSALRYKVGKNNKKLREYIIGRALYSALPVLEQAPNEEKSDYLDDPLGIAIPWEEKYGKKNAKRKNRIKV